MFVVDPFRLVKLHSFRVVVKDSELVNLLPDMFLACLCSHNHGLTFINVHLQIPDGFISPICDHDNFFEPGMLQISQNDCQASGIRSVSGQCPVIYRHMLVKRVHDNFHRLRKRKLILAFSVMDIGQTASPGGPAGRVNCTQFMVFKAFCPAAEQIHPVLFRNRLS